MVRLRLGRQAASGRQLPTAAAGLAVATLLSLVWYSLLSSFPQQGGPTAIIGEHGIRVMPFQALLHWY
jgi:hypothetical protein